MKGETIPDQHHIARYCKPMTIEDGQIQASAFMLRKDEESLSVNWLEFFNCPNRESEVVELRNVYASKFDRVGSSAKIAILNVGEVCEKVLIESPDGRNLEVRHDPQTIKGVDDPSHGGIYNLKQDDDLIVIAELILETVQETYPARKSVV